MDYSYAFLFRRGKARTYCIEWDGKLPDGFYESVCSFRNAFGGIVYIGMRDDGTVTGMDEDEAKALYDSIVRDFKEGTHIKPGFMKYKNEVLHDFLYIAEDGTLRDTPLGGKVVLVLYIYVDWRNIYTVSDRIYDTFETGAVDITDDEVARLHLELRKSGESTEMREIPGLSMDDMDADTLRRAREMAFTKERDPHWQEWTDEGFIGSLMLMGITYGTNEKRYSLGALLLFGKDESLHRLFPEYSIDMILRAEDGTEKTERIACNLLKAYDILMDFAHENVSQYRDADATHKQAWDNIFRNLIVNFLIHREYISPLPARIIISPETFSTENGHDAEGAGEITPDYDSPFTRKENALADAFREVGLCWYANDGLQEIVDNCKIVSAKPVFIEGNTFKATVYM